MTNHGLGSYEQQAETRAEYLRSLNKEKLVDRVLDLEQAIETFLDGKNILENDEHYKLWEVC